MEQSPVFEELSPGSIIASGGTFTNPLTADHLCDQFPDSFTEVKLPRVGKAILVGTGLKIGLPGVSTAFRVDERALVCVKGCSIDLLLPCVFGEAFGLRTFRVEFRDRLSSRQQFVPSSTHEARGVRLIQLEYVTELNDGLLAVEPAGALNVAPQDRGTGNGSLRVVVDVSEARFSTGNESPSFDLQLPPLWNLSSGASVFYFVGSSMRVFGGASSGRGTSSAGPVSKI